ncbi:pyridoxal-phosphate dependent protein [Aeromicrobium marinum DSM 15272]|uniref:Pyridoxal-phosphate dependent protein n=1 Tax=Aeromicrobium marinum DSM 15272 TaxID=585531 RepID=E2SC97_9ACTN|nr:pyridoxal-phosphate dependent protein [Aeromicrobium marinum DSM 15272]
MVDPVGGERVSQGVGDVLLPDDLGEGLRPVAAVQREGGVHPGSLATGTDRAHRPGPAPGRVHTGGVSLDLPTLDRARAVVARHFGPTPQHEWPLLGRALGATAWVKHENQTPTGAFKVRGGLVYVERLRRERPRVRGIVSATRGNHGQSLAWAGRQAGLEVVIVVPHGNSPDKNAAMEAFGAELVVHGHDFQEAAEHSAELAAERGLEAVPPFHPDLVAGVATYAAEFLVAAPFDTVYVPVGMGSGISGLIAVRDLLGLPTEIVGVVSEAAPATARSFAAGTVTPADASTFVDGVACRRPDPTALAVMVAGAARIVTVSEDLAADAMRLVLGTVHQLPEPAGSLAFAGALAETDHIGGSTVGMVLSGGNCDADLLQTVLAGRTPAA